MRKLLPILLVMSLVFIQVVPVQACPDKEICPIMVLNNSKELNLSRKQRSEVKKVKEQMLQELDVLRAKTGKQVRAILSPDQVKKYEKIMKDKKNDDKVGEKGGSCRVKK